MIKIDNMSKILDNIEPFNEIFYKNCFYDALFPIIRHFNRPELAFTANNLFFYDLDTSQPLINFKHHTIHFVPENDLYNLLGIGIINKTSSSDIIRDLITAVNNDRPVIIYIDCFYESIRPDAYNKNHFPHTILIYGYDSKEKNFHILEHNYRESYLYEKRTISYLDIVNSYHGYLENLFEDHSHQSYCEFYLKRDTSFYINDDICKKFYVDKLLENEQRLIYGLDYLKLFIEKFMNITDKESILLECMSDLLKVLYEIITNKKLERYIVLKLFTKPSFIVLCNSIINTYTCIRGIISKFKLSMQYDSRSFKKAAEKLMIIYQLEKSWYNNLFSLCRIFEKEGKLSNG